MADVSVLESGMQMLKTEYKDKSDKPAVLKNFFKTSEEKVNKLKSECQAAQVVTFSNCNCIRC